MASKDKSSSFSFIKRPASRPNKHHSMVDPSQLDSLPRDFKGSPFERSSAVKGNSGRFTASTENLTDPTLDEEGYEITPTVPTFIGKILRGIDKSEFQELIDQIPDEKPLSREEMNFLNGSAGATLRELRATTGALLSLAWDNASQYTEGAIKIGGLRPCRQQAQQKINELISNIHSKTIDSSIPLQLAFDLKLNYLPVKPGFLYKPKFSNCIEIFGPSEEEVEQTALEVDKRLSVPTFVRTQFKYSRVTCFLGSYHPTRQFCFETLQKDYPLHNLPKGTYQHCTFADASSNEMDVNTQGLMNLAGILNQSVPKIRKTSLPKEGGNEIVSIPKSGIWSTTENLVKYVISTRIPALIYQNNHPYFFCQLGKVIYSSVPTEIKSNNWNIEETFFNPKLTDLVPKFNTHAKLDLEEVCKKLNIKQKATIKYRLQVKHLDNRNYLIFTFTFRMDGQPTVISAESPEHHKVCINCICPDKKYDLSLVIAKKESLLDMDTQARFLYSLKLNDCGQLICEPGSEYEVVSAESIDCNTIEHGHYVVSCEQKQVLYSSDISRMLFYTKSLQPTQGKLLIDFTYGRRMSQVIAESVYMHEHIDRLSYENPSESTDTSSVDRNLSAPSPDTDKNNEYVMFSPNHGNESHLSADDLKRDRSESMPVSTSIPDGIKSLYVSGDLIRKSVRKRDLTTNEIVMNQDLLTIGQTKLGSSNENLDATQSARQTSIQQLKRVNVSTKHSNTGGRPTNIRFLHIEDTDTYKELERITNHDLESLLDLILTII